MKSSDKRDLLVLTYALPSGLECMNDGYCIETIAIGAEISMMKGSRSRRTSYPVRITINRNGFVLWALYVTKSKVVTSVVQINSAIYINNKRSHLTSSGW